VKASIVRGAVEHASIAEPPGARAGRAVFAGAVLGFVGVAVPLIWRGAPLADDFNNCVASANLGLGGFLAASWHQLGAIRPARFLEILLAAGVCPYLPFGVAIAVSLLLTLAVAWLTRGFLRDLDTPEAWANVGGAVWLLQPLGTEAGLWPAALHVPLGLALALVSLRFYRRGQMAWAAAANLGAALSVEQVIFPLPVLAWFVAPAGARRRAALVSAGVGAAAIASFLLFPGGNPRLRVGFGARLAGLTANPAFYAGFPAVGLGLHSMPLAIRWALPWSVVILVAGAVAGWIIAPPLASAARRGSHRDRLRAVLVTVTVIVLANVVVVLAVPQQGSPRVFAPTWLVLAVAASAGAAAVEWRRARLWGLVGGLYAAGALLSLLLSVTVRLRSADFTERAVAVIASRVDDEARVAICDVRRTVVDPAPRGAFAVHEFLQEWAAERALLYYTGRRATISLSGELWGRPCPAVSNGITVIDFDELAARPQ
jgi:hypothetical protein